MTDGTGRKRQGTLSIDRKDENHEILKMLNSSLPLGEGSLIEFIYTPTDGEALISFRAGFDSNYSVEFTGTADNGLCPKNVFCGHAGYFTVEGQYVVRGIEGQIADKGTFDIAYHHRRNRCICCRYAGLLATTLINKGVRCDI